MEKWEKDRGVKSKGEIVRRKAEEIVVEVETWRPL